MVDPTEQIHKDGPLGSSREELNLHLYRDMQQDGTASEWVWLKIDSVHRDEIKSAEIL